MEQQHFQKKIGILGGSFDPIHQGHLNIAESAREEFSLDEVWFIPAGHSPNKEESSMSAAEVRAEMTALALLDYPYFKMSSMEIESAETSYTYRTLTKLCACYPNAKFYFIMGADSLMNFETWREPEEICRLCVIVVAVRDHMPTEELDGQIAHLRKRFHADIRKLSSLNIDISSRTVRSWTAQGRSCRYYLPDEVISYIEQQGIYREEPHEAV